MSSSVGSKRSFTGLVLAQFNLCSFSWKVSTLPFCCLLVNVHVYGNDLSLIVDNINRNVFAALRCFEGVMLHGYHAVFCNLC